MTKQNIKLNINYPFLLKPAAKDYLWGGNKLNKEFSKEIDMEPLAETWECSTHPDGLSVINSGPLKGQTLNEVIKKYPYILGTHPKEKDRLPILVKLIDAKMDLSIQVHPSDEYAIKYENGSLGKTEMWYILDADKESNIIYGFNSIVDKKMIKKSIETGTIEKYLNKVKVKKDDLFYIKSGTIHAIGSGILVAEIQQNSNLTYRLYDYNRRDKNGNLRPLHIDKALDVIDMDPVYSVKQPMRLFQYKNGCSEELLCRCEYFEVRKAIINTEKCKKMFDFKTKENSFHVLLCVDGCGSIISDNDNLHFFKGDCIFVPANSENLKIHGIMTLLDINC